MLQKMQDTRSANIKWIQPLLIATLIICLLLIIALVSALKIAGKRLDIIASVLKETAEQHITADVKLDTKLPLNSNFEVADEVVVGIDMVVETSIPINIEIPVNENMLVPFKIGIKDYIKLDTSIMITKDVYAMVEDTIFLDQKVTVPTSKKRELHCPSKPVYL